MSAESNLVFLSTLVNDTTQLSPMIEVDILNTAKQVLFQTQLTRDFPYLFDASSIDNYLFLTYADVTGLKMDVFYWGVRKALGSF